MLLALLLTAVLLPDPAKIALAAAHINQDLVSGRIEATAMDSIQLGPAWSVLRVWYPKEGRYGHFLMQTGSLPQPGAKIYCVPGGEALFEDAMAYWGK